MNRKTVNKLYRLYNNDIPFIEISDKKTNTPLGIKLLQRKIAKVQQAKNKLEKGE